MNEKSKISNVKWLAGISALVVLHAVFFVLNSVAVEGPNGTNAVQTTNEVVAPVTNSVPEKTPKTPREFFNAGTRRLREGKLREAENYFQSALAFQQERWQPPALHNLGHVRYQQGAEELKKSPDAASTMRQAERALDRGERAVEEIREVMPGVDLQKMVTAYLNGRGARRELKDAIDLTRRAIEAHGAALLKWQRALGDFKSALELNPDDADAKRNIEIIEEAIAKLLDKIKQMGMFGQMMAQQRMEIGEMMRQLRGKIPAPEAPPGGTDGDEFEDVDDNPRGPRPGHEEGRGRDGEEMRKLSPEEAGWILESFKLGGDKRLPMGPGEEKKPREQKGKNW